MKNSRNNYTREFVSGICGAAGAMIFNMIATSIQKQIEERKMKNLVLDRVLVERNLAEYGIRSKRAAKKALDKQTISYDIYKQLIKTFNDIDNGYSKIYEMNDPTSQFVEAVVDTTR